MVELSVKGDGHKRARSRMMVWCCAGAVLLGTGSASRAQAGATEVKQAETKMHSGPTLQLQSGSSQAVGNSTADFMYFIPLISPEPVRALTSSRSTQATRLTTVKRRESGSAFTTTCEFEFTGEGSQRSVFDCTRQVQQHERELKAGGELERQLRSITVSGPGHGRVEVQGTVIDGVPTVTQVRLRFDAQGQPSPVSIGLSNIRYVGGTLQHVNEVVARVNTLTFHRQPGPPKMEVSVASVKNKGAGDNLWQNFKATVKGAAANLLIPPLSIEMAGQDAMLNFGHALASGAPSFTFPLAKNLQPGPG